MSTTREVIISIMRLHGVRKKDVLELWRSNATTWDNAVKHGRLYLADLKWLADILQLSDVEILSIVKADIAEPNFDKSEDQ